MSRGRIGTVVLLGSLALGIATRVVKPTRMPFLTHDDVISCSAATGHQGEYVRVTRGESWPYGAWARASEWKRFIRLEKTFCFRDIRAGLSRADLHPPMYFWLLHLWYLAFGVRLASGAMLNVLLDVITALLLYRLACSVLGDRLEAAAVAAVWILARAVVSTSWETRQYALLALCAVLLASQVVRWADTTKPVGWWRFAALAVVTAMGLLTHYYFVLAAGGSALLLAATLRRKRMARLLGGLASMATGAGLFVLLHPGFAGSFRIQRVEAPELGFHDLPARLGSLASATASFILMNRQLLRAGLIAGAAFVGCVLVLRWRQRFSIRQRLAGEATRGLGIVLLIGLWIWGAIALSYLAGCTHPHGIRPKYFCMVWPFAAFVPVLACRLVGRGKALLLAGLCVLLALNTARATMYDLRRPVTPERRLPRLVNQSDRIVTDNVYRGVLLRWVWFVADDKMMFVARQSHLAERAASWAPQLDSGSCYVSFPASPAAVAGQQQILQSIRSQAGLDPASRTEIRELSPVAHVYRFRAASGGADPTRD